MSIKVIESRRDIFDSLKLKLEDNGIKYDITLAVSTYIHSDCSVCVGNKYIESSVEWVRWYRGFVIIAESLIPDTPTPTYESVVTLVEQLDVEVMWMDAIIDMSIDKGIDDAPSDQYEFPTLSEIVNYAHDITQQRIDTLNELRALGIIV